MGKIRGHIPKSNKNQRITRNHVKRIRAQRLNQIIKNQPKMSINGGVDTPKDTKPNKNPDERGTNNDSGKNS